MAIKSLENSDKHISTMIDVRGSEAVNVWIDSTVQKLGKLDGAINMAGVVTPATPVSKMSDDACNLNFDVNACGVFYCIRA